MYFVTIIIPINTQYVGYEREAFMSYLDHVNICMGKSHKKTQTNTFNLDLFMTSWTVD